ncbi:McrC family protein [Saccharothrix sp. HUAS TT1]|uniref:McrC family protein n=1 Tax=unclassified Saccharothrix TaxID=2593673 RepID=UPI00345B4E1C
MPSVELREYERAEVDGWSRDDVRALRAAVPSLSADHLGGERWWLTPGHHVGFLRVGGHHVHIRPKVELRNLLHLLSHATDRLAWREELVATSTDAHPVAAMAHLLAESALRATRRGVLQGYRRRDEALAVVRGRWRVEDQVRRHQGRLLPAEVGYDDYTEDIAENRVIATALRLVRGGALDLAARRRVSRALARFGEHVESLPRPRWSDPPAVDWHPLNAHYRGAVELARLVLQGAAVTHRAGPSAAHGVLVDMNDLFERFVRRSLRDLLDGDVRGAGATKRVTLDQEGLIGLQPDVLWLRDGVPLLVADVKYKKLAGGARNADLYQVHAYCTAWHVEHGLLVHATDGGVTRHRIVDGRTTISVVGVDLRGTPEDITASVEAVADEARALAASSGIPGRTRRPEGQGRARVR